MNKPGLAVDSRGALTAIGALLADPSLHKPKARNLFEKCKDQTAFDGKLSLIYEDPETGDIVREECTFCVIGYATAGVKEMARNPALRNADVFGKGAAFDRAYAPEFKKEIAKRAAKGQYKYGATLVNQLHKFVAAAPGADKKLSTDVFFALGKYANTRCKTLQEIRSASQAGISGNVRTAA